VAVISLVFIVETIRGNKIDARIEPEYSNLQVLYKIGCSKAPPRHSIFVSKLKSSEKGVIGVCLKGWLRNIIIIDEDFFNSADKRYIESTLAHEMSHCFLDIKHRNNPNSYMHEIISSDITRSRLYFEFLLDVRENCR
jgi:hypothetical protein